MGGWRVGRWIQPYPRGAQGYFGSSPISTLRYNPIMGLQRIPHPRFGGINLALSSFNLEPHEASDLLNVRPKSLWVPNRQGIVQRAGRTLWSSGIAQSGVAYVQAARQGIHNFESLISVVVVEGDLWRVNTYDQATPTRIFDGVDGSWALVVAPNSTGTLTLWAAPRGGTNPTRSWDFIAGSAAAWTGVPFTYANDLVYWRGLLVACGVTGGTMGGSGGARLVWSAPYNPESFPTTNFIDQRDTEGFPRVMGATVVQDRMFVLTSTGLWMYYDVNTFASRKVSDAGLRTWSGPPIYGKSIVSNDSRVYWVSSEPSVGVWSIDSAGAGIPVLETRKINPILEGMPNGLIPEMCSLVLSPQGTVLFSYWDSNVGVSRFMTAEIVPIKPGEPDIYIHDLNHWTLFHASKRVVAGGNASYLPMLSGSTPVAIGSMYEMFSGASDSGTAISSFWQSGKRPFLSEEPKERVRRLNIVYSGQPTVQVSSDSASQSKTFPDSATKTFDKFRPETRGRYHQFKLSNSTLNKTMDVDFLEFAIRGGKEH